MPAANSTLTAFLVISGALTAIAGTGALIAPAAVLRFAFHEPSGPITFFVRHWGLLIALVGALTVWSAGVPAARDGILVAAIVEKYAIGLLVFFGPIKRTLPMTAVALADGAFATVYLISLATT